MRSLAFVLVLLLLDGVGRVHSASLTTEVVLPNQLGSGVANTSTCQNRMSTGASCDGGSPAGITYARTSQNWSQTSTVAMTGGTPVSSFTLTPCPAGVDYTSGAGYQVYIADGASSEAVSVTGGATGSGNCTIAFTPFFSHPLVTSYTIGSASSGIQESINSVCGVNSSYTQNGFCNVTIPANGFSFSLNTYTIQGTIVFHGAHGTLSGYGSSLACIGRGPCLQIGDRLSSSHSVSNAIKGINFRTSTDFSANSAYAGVAITNTQATGGFKIITTATAHHFRPGDLVTIQFIDDRSYQGDALVADCGTSGGTAPCTGSSTSFRIASASTIASQATPGVVALAYEAILDNCSGTTFTDVHYDYGGDVGHFNNFFDFWDDEVAIITAFNNNAISLNHNANWVGAYIYSGGNANFPSVAASPVITLRDSSITGNSSNGITVNNSNGLYVDDTVIQATGMWEAYVGVGLQGATFKDVYNNGGNQGLNSVGGTPYGGLGEAGFIGGAIGSSATYKISGNGGFPGTFHSGGVGATPYTYYIVAHDVTATTYTSPMQILNWSSTGSDTIPVKWPRIASGTDVITYDVIRMTTPINPTTPYPWAGTSSCPGGAGGICGSVAVGISQATACSGTLICTYTDTGSSTTSAYAIQLGTYAGVISFWPGAIVTVNTGVIVDKEQGPIVGVGLFGSPAQIAAQCSNLNGVSSPGGYTSCQNSVTGGVGVPNQPATFMSDGWIVGGVQTLTKGRLNFTTTPYTTMQPHHIITLIDSQPGLTHATPGLRPAASANDTWIGTDVNGNQALSTGQLAFGAPVSITNYIRALGDGAHSNWLERLTSTQKTFKVPVKIYEGNSFTLGDGSPLSQMKIYSANDMPASRVPPHSCIDVVGEAKGISKSDHITSITPPGRLGNISLNAYPADEGAIILHFCNPSNSEVITPTGAYSFLAVR